MEHSEGPLYSAGLVLDYKINEPTVAQPDLPETSIFKRIWHGLGRVEALCQINHTSTARATRQPYYNEVRFVPKLKPEYHTDAIARILAREHINTNLKKMGFHTTFDASADKTRLPHMFVTVPLNSIHNIRKMRVFGPYILFDKEYVLNPIVLTGQNSRKR